MPQASAREPNHFWFDEEPDHFDAFEPTSGEPPFHPDDPATSGAGLLDVLLLHRWDLPFVLDPWAL